MGDPTGVARALWGRLDEDRRLRIREAALRGEHRARSAGATLTADDPHVRHWRSRLADLRGQHAGQRCFVMGNGPSLNVTRLDLLGGEHVFGSNRVHLLFDRIDWRPEFYVAVDDRVVPDIANEITQLQADLDQTSFFFPLAFRLDGVLKSHPRTWWYRQDRLAPWQGPEAAFSTDATRGVRSVRTVTVAAMQLAVHLGFKEIHLIGCDTSYSVPKTVAIEGDRADDLVSTRDDDANHFDPTYFGAGRRWHEPHVDRMIEHYVQAKDVCDRAGVRVFNATVGGALEVFPRVDHRDVLGGAK